MWILFLFGFPFPELFLKPTSGFAQLLSHHSLKALKDVRSGILVIQVPQILLDQGLLVAFEHQAVEQHNSRLLLFTWIGSQVEIHFLLF